MLLKVFMKSLVEQLTRSSYIKHYNTISVVLLAVLQIACLNYILISNNVWIGYISLNN